MRKTLLIGFGATVAALTAAWLIFHTSPLAPDSQDKADKGLAELVRQYVRSKEGWDDGDYRVEETNQQDPAGNLIVNVIHRDDDGTSGQTGGKSLQLHVDLKAKKVVQVFHSQ
jgi:hypothetical protein